MNRSSYAAMRWLVGRYARPYAAVIVLVAVVTLVANLFTVLQPAILAALLSNLSETSLDGVPDDAATLDLNYLGPRVTQWLWGSLGTDADLLLFFGLLFVAQAVLAAGCNYLSGYGGVWIRVKVARLIQLDLIRHILGQDMSFFTRQKSGELISRATVDVNNTANALGPLVFSIIHHSVQVVVYSAYLFSTSVWLTVGALLLLLLQFGLTQILRRPVRRVTRDETDTAASLSTALQEAFTSIRVTKSFGAERFELSKLRTAIDGVVESLLRKGRISVTEAPGRSILDAVAVLGIFLIAISQVRAGLLTFEGLLLFTYVGRSLIAPINHLATSALWVDAMGGAWERIDSLMAEPPSVPDGSQLKTSFDRVLTLDHVSFSYDATPAVADATLEIKKGEFIAIVGPSGAGKSTLSDLILRLYDPDTGCIRIDGVDLRDLKKSNYREIFGVVSQESLLFHDTVLNNIRYGRDAITDQKIIEAARVANAHDFIMKLPQQYDTITGDRGIRLSGGERQRVAIARAVVHNPQILILDEATSALDSESERSVQKAIDQVVEQTTAIIIAHRLSTVTHADRIVVLSEGRIEAVGSHEHLLGDSPTYERFCRLQFDAPMRRTLGSVTP